MSERPSLTSPIAKMSKSFWDYFKLRRILPNPGKYEDIQKEPRNILLGQEMFDGAKFEMNRAVVQTEKHGFTVTHSIALGSKEEPPGYNFSTTYGTDHLLLNGRMYADGKLMARYHHQFTPSLGIKFMAQVSPSEQEQSAWTNDIDYKGGNYFASLKVGFPLVLGVSYMQSVTPKLSFGCEGVYQNTYRISLVSFGSRYEGEDFIATGMVNNDIDIDLTYTKNVNEKVSLCTELMYSNTKQVTSSSIGFDYRLTGANIRGTIESSGRVLTMVEEKLTDNTRFTVSAELDHVKKDYNFGVGFTIL